MFVLEDVYSFGSGALNDCEISGGATDKVNSFARVTAISANQITLDTANWRLGDYETFVAGNDILIHVSAGNAADKLGCYLVAKILLVSGDDLTLDKDFSSILADSELIDYYVQAVTFANFDCLKLLDGGIITPPPFDPTKFYGGIVAVKVKNDLIFDGGHISLSDCGIPTYYKDLRPLTAQETEANGVLDSAPLAGEENYGLQERFLLNCGDGAAFIVAKNVTCTENSRIGNLDTHGKPHCRGAADSPFKPSNVTNIGGSSILIATEKFKKFSSNLISKYRTASDSIAEQGAGLARAYIAELKPRHDDGLFAGDFLSNKNRLGREHNLFGFGTGEDGELTNPSYQLNNFAEITTSHEELKFYDEISRRALINFAEDTPILLLGNGDFYFDKSIEINGNAFKTETKFDAELVVSLPQFSKFTLNQAFTAKKVFALLVSDTCNLESADITADKIFIIAKSLQINAATKFNAPTVIVADSIAGLSETPFKAKNNLVFVNEVI